MRLRTVLLERIARLGPDSFREEHELPSSAMGPWITMGHFDAMYTYSLEIGGGIFDAMERDVQRLAARSNGKTYFHPLYLVSQEDDGVFWDTPAWNVGVLRLHMATTGETTDSCELLRRELREYEYARFCSYQVYYTVELSDLVIAVKTEKLSDLMNFSLNLRKFLYVGKVYSYFGIDYRRLYTSEYDGGDKIAFCSMRFAVSHAPKAGELLKTVKEKMGDRPDYSITGVDDVMIYWEELPAERIYKLYRALFAPGAFELHLSDAFSDITTRVGIREFPTTRSRLDGVENPVPESGTGDRFDGIFSPAAGGKGEFDGICGILVEHNRSFQERLRDNGYDWLKPLSELMNTLVYMSRNVVLDSFLFLMLPAVQALFRNVEEIAGTPFSREDVRKCHEFVGAWNHLMELVTRTEGQLSHYPELRPLVFDIPVIMLEYTLSFLNRCAEILQREDDEKQEIQFLLVPQLCQRIRAEELFPAMGTLPGLILVQLPYDGLYNTFSIQTNVI